MTSRALLAGLGVFAVACPAEVAAPRRPNVLLVVLDTTRVDVFGSYGHPGGATPNVDRLAASGTRFTRAYTVTPLTIPAHSSLMTGLYPPRHGVRDNGDYFLDEGAVTLAERLKEGGYQTMASVAAEVTSHHWGFAQGFDAYFDDLGTASAHGNRWAVERPGDQVVDDALGWLAAPERGTDPWFAWVHLFDPHHPYEPRPEFAERFAGRPYLAEVAFADAQVGRLIDALEAKGSLDDTLIVVLADHGEGFGDHGEGQHGMLLYNATTRIPMVVRPPGGLPEARVEDVPASLVDVFPTVLSVVGLPAVTDIDGIDLAGALMDDRARPNETRTVYAESLYAWHVYGWAPQYALIDATHKLVDSTTPELYAKGDPQEMTDLAPAEPARVSTMRETLARKVEGWEAAAHVSGRADLSSERVSQLAALGYLGGSAPTDAAPAAGLPDPVKQMPILVRVEEARAAAREGRLADAEALLREVLAQDPGLIPPRQALVEVLGAQGRFEEAITVAREAVERGDSSLTRSLLGLLLLRSGRPAEARVELERALEKDPYLAATWAPYLQLLYQGGDIAGIRAALERVEALLPDAPFVLTMKGALLVDTGRHADAEPLFERALAADPKIPLARYFLGVIAGARGEEPTAEARYLAEIEAYPAFFPARLKLIELYGKQTRYEDQIAQIEALAKPQGHSPLTRYALGQALFNLGRYDEAAVEVTACRAAWPTYPECAMLQANVLAKQGDRARAEEVYREALELKGQTPPPTP